MLPSKAIPFNCPKLQRLLPTHSRHSKSGRTAFVRMRVQHMRMKDKWADWMAARGMPYEDVENMRPETKEMVQSWLKIYGDAKEVVLGVESAGELI